jgi:predicted ribonuclease YlaK
MENKLDLKKFNKVFVPITVLEELDKHKHFGDDSRSYKARKALRYLSESENVIYIVYEINSLNKAICNCLDMSVPDNKIIAYAYSINVNHKSTLYTSDLNMYEKTKALNIPCFLYNDVCEGEEYTGWKIVNVDTEEWASFYSNDKSYSGDMPINQYLLIEQEGKIEDVFCKTVDSFRKLNTKKIESKYMGKFKPYDLYQKCAVDALFNNQMVMLKGKAGSGKSLIALSYAFNMIDSGKFDKLIIFANTHAAKNSAKLGYYPGSKDEKLLDSQIGNMLSCKLGDKHAIEQLISEGKLVLLPFSDIRGYDTTNSNSIVYITEAQNLDIDLMKLAIQRVSSDCQLIIDGDYNTQVDCSAFEGLNNGMKRVSEVFRGKDFYAEVELVNIYRSKLAEVAENL